LLLLRPLVYLFQTKKSMIVQRLKKVSLKEDEIARRYYAILSTLNDFQLTEREVQLMGFIATAGSISISEKRQDFCTKFKTTSATINNMVSKLKRKQLLVKKDGHIVVNPIISLDFKKDLQLEVKLLHG